MAGNSSFVVPHRRDQDIQFTRIPLFAANPEIPAERSILKYLLPNPPVRVRHWAVGGNPTKGLADGFPRGIPSQFFKRWVNPLDHARGVGEKNYLLAQI